MSRIVVRRAPPGEANSPRFSLASALLGVAAGGGIALLVHQIWKAANEPDWAPGHPRPRERSSGAIAAAHAVLDADLRLRDCGLDLLPGARGAIELHGWVATRSERARAARLVREAVAPADLVNAVLVRGEDDGDDEEQDLPDADAASA